MAKQVLMFLGIKMANLWQQVLKPLGSYKQVFTVIAKQVKKSILIKETKSIKQ